MNKASKLSYNHLRFVFYHKKVTIYLQLLLLMIRGLLLLSLQKIIIVVRVNFLSTMRVKSKVHPAN